MSQESVVTIEDISEYYAGVIDQIAQYYVGKVSEMRGECTSGSNMHVHSFTEDILHLITRRIRGDKEHRDLHRKAVEFYYDHIHEAPSRYVHVRGGNEVEVRKMLFQIIFDRILRIELKAH